MFVGIGELPVRALPGARVHRGLIDVAMRALARRRAVDRRDIDTILLIPCLHSFDDQADLVFSRVVEELGLHGRARRASWSTPAGRTSDNAVRVAVRADRLRPARNVLVLQCRALGLGRPQEMVDMLTANGIPREWERPPGLTFNAIGALITQRYMHASGSTPEEMASVCVALREWANLNPNAMYKDKTLTVEQILGSKVSPTRCTPWSARCSPTAPSRS